MKKIIIAVVMFPIILMSCKKESLQTYLVDVKEKPNFVTFDFSTSILPIKLIEKAPKEDKKALESIRKVNVAFLQKDRATETEIETEKKKLKSILKRSNYKTLMRFNHKGAAATVYYLGKTDAINEIIAFGYADELGIGIARLLGKDMNPNALIKMLKSIEADDSKGKMKKIKEVFEKMEISEKE